MKKLMALAVVTGLLTGCGHPANIDGKTYDTYGFLNQDTAKNPNIRYEISVGNVIWSCILVETIFAPVYLLGFDLFNPISKIDTTTAPNANNGVIQ